MSVFAKWHPILSNGFNGLHETDKRESGQSPLF